MRIVEQATVVTQIRLKSLFEPANWLTLVRLPLAGLLWIAPSNRAWLFGILAVAAASDMIDGTIAKELRAKRVQRGDSLEEIGRSHAIGAWLDPLCDKTFVASILVATYVGMALEAWMVFAILARELVLVPCALVYSLSSNLKRCIRFDFRAGLSGKAATVAQFSALSCAILDLWLLVPLVHAAAILGLSAALIYLHKAARLARWLVSNQFAHHYWRRMQTQQFLTSDAGQYHSISPSTAKSSRHLAPPISVETTSTRVGAHTQEKL